MSLTLVLLVQLFERGRAQEQRAVERTGSEELARLRLSQNLDQSETRSAALYKEVPPLAYSTVL